MQIEKTLSEVSRILAFRTNTHIRAHRARCFQGGFVSCFSAIAPRQRRVGRVLESGALADEDGTAEEGSTINFTWQRGERLLGYDHRCVDSIHCTWQKINSRIKTWFFVEKEGKFWGSIYSNQPANYALHGC